MTVIHQNKAPGDLDETFANKGLFEVPDSEDGSVRGIAQTTQSRLVYAVLNNGFAELRRTTPDGLQDDGFGEQGGVTRWRFDPKVTAIPWSVLVQPDGKTLVLGSAMDTLSKGRAAVTRFNENGTPDLIFGTRIIPYPVDPVPPDYRLTTRKVRGCLVSDGKLLVASDYTLTASDGSDQYQQILLHRFDRSGEPDADFGTVEVQFKAEASTLEGVGVLSDGRIVVYGTLDRVSGGVGHPRAALACYDAEGQLDKGFADGGYWEASDQSQQGSVRVHGDKIVVAALARIDEAHYVAVHRLRADGRADSSFNGGNGVLVAFGAEAVFPVTADVQSDEKIVIGGSTFELGKRQLICLRLQDNGLLDQSFGDAGIMRYSEGVVFDGLIQVPFNRIVLAADVGAFSANKVPHLIGLRSA